jgi:hypothetical protein
VSALPRDPQRLTAWILVFLLLPSQGVLGAEGPIRVLCLGDVIDQFGGFNSFVVIREDPAIVTTLVPSRPDYVSPEVAAKNLRAYMPRNRDSYFATQDVTVMSDCDREIIQTEWIRWMTDSVVDGGLGFLWLGSIASQDPAFESWEGTTLAAIAPVTPHPRRDIWGSFQLVNNAPGEPMMDNLPWEESPRIEHFNTQIPRAGSSTWASTRRFGYPLITFMSPGNGRIISFSGKFPLGMENWARQWRFYPQAMIYMTYRVAGREIPTDPSIFERMIRAFHEHQETSSLILSILDFAERFGAKVSHLHSQMGEMAGREAEARGLYIASDYDAALLIMDDLGEGQLSLVESSMRQKDRALVWVYVTEWLAFLGTFLLSSSVLWTVMVRRRLYAEAGLSTFRRAPQQDDEDRGSNDRR